MPDRLFVPLNTEPYRWFEAGEKDVELRGVDDRFNAKTVYSGRRAELRRGYSTDDSLWGTVQSVWFFEYLGQIPEKVDHNRIVPEVEYVDFVDRIGDVLGWRDRYIAFEVEIDG